MIVVHGHESEAGGGDRADRRVLLDVEHIVAILNGSHDGALIVSQSQTKDGSIMLAVEETQWEVARLRHAWGINWSEGAVAVQLAEGKIEYLDELGGVFDPAV